MMAPRPQIMTSVCRKLNKVDIPLFFKIYCSSDFLNKVYFFTVPADFGITSRLNAPAASGRQSTDLAFRVCHTPPNHILASNILLKKKYFLVAQLPDYKFPGLDRAQVRPTSSFRKLVHRNSSRN
jgi:hypothetical protein